LNIFASNPDAFIRTEEFSPEPGLSEVYDGLYAEIRNKDQSLASISHEIDDLFS